MLFTRQPSLFGRVPSGLSRQNKRRAMILYAALMDLNRHWAELRDTFSTGYPVPVAEIESILRTAGVSNGDNLHVHVSLEHLLAGAATKRDAADLPPVQYAKQLLDLLFDVIGSGGTLTMATDHSVKAINRGLIDGDNTEFVFDYRRHQSTRGIMSELLRRRKGTERSIYLWKNLSVNGALAQSFVDSEEHMASRYTMGRRSFWDSMAESSGKVVFLGNPNLGTNTYIHYFDNIFPDELPTPVFFAKPVTVRYINRAGNLVAREFIINAPVYTSSKVVNFCTYLDQQHHIYKYFPLHNRGHIIVYSIQDQLRAQKEEMEKHGLTWWHRKF
jgi:aminoglycoside N3'-acetyltransferase